VVRTSNSKKPGFVRIIGGEWRGRRLPVIDLPGLRPTGDRARETLFNWLQPHLRGAHCADLFAGTGVLGLEALSRGAAEVTLVENTPLAVQALRAALVQLQVLGPKSGLHLVETDALKWLQGREPRSRDLVRAGGFVYIETARNAPPLHPGLGWEISREKTLGEVRMLLLKKI
jgi:16S rRNA (guanine966-N2)-methyltransferase